MKVETVRYYCDLCKIECSPRHLEHIIKTETKNLFGPSFEICKECWDKFQIFIDDIKK